MKKLSEKQIDFADNYLLNNESKEGAAREAGYSHSAGEVLLRNPKVQAYLQEARATIEKDGIATFKWKAAKLRQIIELCLPDWAQSAEEVDVKSALAAIALLNAMQGDIAPTKNLNWNLNQTVAKSIEETKEAARQYTHKEY